MQGEQDIASDTKYLGVIASKYGKTFFSNIDMLYIIP